MPISPPRPKMPLLNSLRAFEAAARTNSFSTAAEELCVTPAAIAQQVKALEAWAGDKLFKRHARGVELTPLGAGVLSDFTDAFDALGGAVQKLRVNANPREVRIAALPSIAQLWVSPRLPIIRNELADISISVTAMETPPNLEREPFDLAIFYLNKSDNFNQIEIEQDKIFPVCSPAIAKELKSYEDLKREVFLHDLTWKNDWEVWTSVVSPNHNLAKSGPEFSLYSLAVEECKNGAGVLMGHEALVRNLIKQGDLIAPFEIEISLPKYLTFIIRNQVRQNRIIKSVIQMLKL